MKKLFLLLLLIVLLPVVFADSTIKIPYSITGTNESIQISIDDGTEINQRLGTSFSIKDNLLKDTEAICGNVSESCQNDIGVLVNVFRNQTDTSQQSMVLYKEYLTNYTVAENTLKVQLDACNQRITDLANPPNVADFSSQLSICQADKKDCEDSKFVWGIGGLIIGALGYHFLWKKNFASEQQVFNN